MRNEIEDLKQQAVEQAKQQLKNMAKESAKKVGQQIWSAIAPVLPYIIIGLTIFIVIVGCIDWGAIEASAATDGMVSASSNSWEQYLKFVALYEGGSHEMVNGVDCYYVEDDSKGNPTIGHGLCLAYNNSASQLHEKHQEEFSNYGYSTYDLVTTYLNGGKAYVPVEICDAIWKSHLWDLYTSVDSTYSDIPLTEYQKFALTDIMYRRGTLSAKFDPDSTNTTFSDYYNAYWNEEFTNKYYGKYSTSVEDNYDTFNKYRKAGNFTHYSNKTDENRMFCFFYNGFDDTNSSGVYRRKVGQWLLFKYGYYAELSEYWQPDVANGGVYATQYESFDNFLFIGDSYTAALDGNSEFNNAIIKAEVGKSCSYWIGKINGIKTEMNGTDPYGISILLGVNNVANNVQGELGKMKELISEVQSVFGTGIPIYVQAVFPVGSGYTQGSITADSMIKDINEYNRQLKDYCNKMLNNVYFIDTTSGCVENGYLKYKTSDELHLTGEGQKIWIENMKDAMLFGAAGGTVSTESSKDYIIGTFTSNITGKTFTVLNQNGYLNGREILDGLCNRASGAIILSGYFSGSSEQLVSRAQNYGSGFPFNSTALYSGYGLKISKASSNINNYQQYFSQQLQKGNYLLVRFQGRGKSGDVISKSGNKWCYGGTNGSHWISIIGYKVENGMAYFFPGDPGWGPYGNFKWFPIDEFENIKYYMTEIYVVQPTS